MRKQTDLGFLKQLAKQFLWVEPETTSFSPMVVKHPFTDSGIVTVRDGGEYRIADITADEAAMSQWREQMASLIENAKTPRHIYMMLTKSYRFAFLKHAMPYFFAKGFFRIPGRCMGHVRNTKRRSKLYPKADVGPIQKADPQILMDGEEYEQFQALRIPSLSIAA